MAALHDLGRIFTLVLALALAACSDDDVTSKIDAADTAQSTSPDTSVPDVAPEVLDTLEPPDLVDPTDLADTEPDVADVADVADVPDVPDVPTCPTCGPLASCTDPLVGCVCDDDETTYRVGDRCYPRDFVDPDLDLDPADAWTILRDSLTHAEAGTIDPGVYNILDGHLAQTLAIPPFGSIPRLAVDIYGKRFIEIGQWDFGTNDRWVALPDPGFSIAATRQCLGEAAYGGDTTFAVRARFTTVDRITLVTDETCPLPGELDDGDFASADGWSLEGQARIVEDAIAGRGAGLELPVDNPCSTTRATRRISVPLAGANALDLTVRTAPDTVLSLELRHRYPASATVDTGGATETVRYCFARFELGTVMPLAFAPRLKAADGSCIAGAVELVAVDDVKFVHDPECDPDTNISDPSFSRLATIRAGLTPTGPGRGTSRFLTAPEAYDDRSLELGGAPCPSGGDAHHWHDLPTRFPRNDAEAGAAVRFVYKTTGDPEVMVHDPSRLIPPAPTWTSWSGCVGPFIADDLRFLRLGTITCGAVTVAFDDVEVYRDPSCKVDGR